MDASVAVALISSSASLVIAGATAGWSARQNTRTRAAQADLELLKHQLQENARAEERLLGIRAQLDRYREPLLVAVDDLGNRIDNIRHQGFLGYLQVIGPRQETALLSSLYRFARYFGRLELLYRGLNMMRFERDEDTKMVAGLLEPTYLVSRDEAGRPTSPPWLVRAVEESAGEAAW